VVDGLALEILQNRPDYGNRVLQLSVTNEGAEPLTVVEARFESEQFAAPALWSKPTEVPAGLTRQLPVQLGEAVCPAPDAHPSLTVIVADATGGTREVSATPADPFGVLQRIAGEDCLDEAVAAIVTLRLDDGFEITGEGADSVAHLRLVAEPVAHANSTPEAGDGGGTVQLDEVGSTILLAPTVGDTWPLGVADSRGGESQHFVLEAVPARCDPHAIAEDKRGTFLPVVLSIPGGASGTVFVRSSDTLRLAIYEFIGSHCGFSTE
jgi:hypothetical protein